ncbi:hypothetical protein B0T21DRAFT_395872 [Apiosordaria backusii]|uniref:Fructose-bisphosphate aldolase n=1 Tax=Apiosordaria backusii TaxID=314023 RepID=A0AA40AN46_9PEZI|nr:hypothetical protein B0T21DRAFT_395872 [Apiosordaria backusii]
MLQEDPGRIHNMANPHLAWCTVNDRTAVARGEEQQGLKPGVIYGNDVLNLFKYARGAGFTLPAIVTSSSTVIASLETARDARAPTILQVSQGGAAYFAGKVNLDTDL